MLRFIKQISALAIVLIALLEAPQETSASSFLPKSFDELVDGADQIVIGTVIGKRGRKLDNGAIVTDVNVSVLAVLKGAPVLRQLDLVVLGGAVGDERLEVAGFPEFIPASSTSCS